jgi:hypothetical protein
MERIINPNRCCKWVCSGERWDFSGHQCRRPIKVWREGKGYCATHDPDYIAKKREEDLKQWEAERKRSQDSAERRELEREYCESLSTEELKSRTERGDRAA